MVRFFGPEKHIYLAISYSINILEMHSAYLCTSLNDRETEEDIISDNALNFRKKNLRCNQKKEN